MPIPPKKISRMYEHLKKDYQFAITLRRIKGKYYVYRDKGVWNKETKKTRIVSEYLGKITDEGIYVKKKLSAKEDFENAKAIIAEHGGEIIWNRTEGESEAPKQENVTQIQQEKPNLRESDLKILMALSMNARMPIPRMSKLVGLSEQTLYSRIKYLEDKLGIKYILEIDTNNLGYIPYLVFIKFEGATPTKKELEDILMGEDKVQFAAVVKGEYDLIIYLIDDGPLKAQEDLLRLRLKDALDRYKAFITLTEFAQIYPFMPLKDAFITKILSDRIWHKSKEFPRPEKTQLRRRELLLLSELNNNSTCEFLQIDKKHDLNKGTARYTYNSLVERGIILRPTITITKLPIKYVGIILLIDTDFRSIKENRYKFLFEYIEYGSVVNKYCLGGNTGAQVGATLFLPVFEDGELQQAVEQIDKKLPGNIVSSSIVTDTLVGSLCYRRFDNAYTRAYRVLQDTKKIAPAKITNYK